MYLINKSHTKIAKGLLKPFSALMMNSARQKDMLVSNLRKANAECCSDIFRKMLSVFGYFCFFKFAFFGFVVWF